MSYGGLNRRLEGRETEVGGLDHRLEPFGRAEAASGQSMALTLQVVSNSLLEKSPEQSGEA